MSAAEGHKFAAFFDQPSGVDIMVVKTDENGCRIECDAGEAPDNSFEGQGIAMGHGFGHPVVSRGKAAGVEAVFLGESFNHREIVDGVTPLG